VTETISRHNEALRRCTGVWVVVICFLGLVFDGYDLVVYGTVLSTLLKDPAWALTPAQAGAIGSYALFGMMLGALAAGAVGDFIGRRRLLLVSMAWFSVGMGLTALATNAALFGAARFFTGIGIGALVAAAGATVAEFAPPGKRNLYNAIVFAGYPVGGVLASVVALAILEPFGFRTLFWIGALPLVTLLPLAFFKMPESPAWLLSRGRVDEARALSEKTGVLLSETPPPAPEPGEKRERVGFAGLFSPEYLWPTVLLGLMSAMGLLLVYSLNTWLPELMLRAGYNAKGSLSFLLVLNGGAVIGALIGSRVADRFGPKPVVASCFLLGAIAIALLTISLPLALLLIFVAVAGLGTSGTQTLIYGFVANYYRTNVRGAGVAWCAGFGRLGGVGGPVIGGLLIGAGLSTNAIFWVLAALAVVGTLLTLVVPAAHRALRSTPIEPSVTVEPAK
jgi:MFS transporter, AAHS family, benzoate transport protein